MSGHIPQVFYKVYLQIECGRAVAAKRDAFLPSWSINFSLLLLSGGGGVEIRVGITPFMVFGQTKS